MKEIEDNTGGKGMQFVIPVNENPRQEKSTIHELRVIGGIGIEGLAVWGRALVTIRKGRKVDHMKQMEDNVGGKGIQFVIPVNENPSGIALQYGVDS
ncbi:hypothetical protein SLEP1_g59274 [Rubroshorea leprosula]|uniref:Uncharacterized protein n=1 Tax=Rubroshorea leprosula TaxID=152421 RepID=A0AAV5MV15_9ROSI|nr:hypothetical protein SLEP1_g59274 [Rubroshorea leprosula]